MILLGALVSRPVAVHPWHPGRSIVDSTGVVGSGALFAMSTLTRLPAFGIFVFFFQRLLIDGIATTGIKG